MVRAHARTGAAQRDPGAHPRAQPGGHESHRRRRGAAGTDAAGGLVQRAARAPGAIGADAEALYRRCRAPDEDPAGRPAHAGGARPARAVAGRTAPHPRPYRRQLRPHRASGQAVAVAGAHGEHGRDRRHGAAGPVRAIAAGGGRVAAQGLGQADRSRLRGARRTGDDRRQCDHAGRDAQQPARQRDPLHARRRPRHGARDHRAVRALCVPGRGRHRPRHSRGRARAGHAAFLSHPRHAGRGQRAGPGDRARDRAAARRRHRGAGPRLPAIAAAGRSAVPHHAAALHAGRGDIGMTPDAASDAPTPARRRWISNMRWIAALLGVWFVVTFVVAFFARDLSMRIFDWPFAYWVAGQGAPIVYVLITMLYAWRTNRLADAAAREAGAAREDAGDASPPPSI
ncbi:conserved hypothetical protein [Ralstonia solanacearum Po82]|uniref:Sodium symporter small subunit domain-containing protein n=2 Tax=Ralstonia solanacearum TaxID=305 RepID=F6G400_RALS8|nr:conserved hypothetical protein [Ralstonia solanacearum Po82]